MFRSFLRFLFGPPPAPEPVLTVEQIALNQELVRQLHLSPAELAAERDSARFSGPLLLGVQASGDAVTFSGLKALGYEEDGFIAVVAPIAADDIPSFSCEALQRFYVAVDILLAHLVPEGVRVLTPELQHELDYTYRYPRRCLTAEMLPGLEWPAPKTETAVVS